MSHCWLYLEVRIQALAAMSVEPLTSYCVCILSINAPINAFLSAKQAKILKYNLGLLQIGSIIGAGATGHSLLFLQFNMLK